VSALVLDAGAFIAVDRNDRSMIARLRVAQLHGHELRTSAIVIAQVWRSPGGKQAGVCQTPARSRCASCRRKDGPRRGRAPRQGTYR